MADYDETRYRLGNLCRRGHDYQGTGQSLRRLDKSGNCVACHRQINRERMRETPRPAALVVDEAPVKTDASPAPKRGRPGVIEDSALLSVRVPQDLLVRLDERLATMRRDLPGVSLTRADVVRSVLETALREGEGAPL